MTTWNIKKKIMNEINELKEHFKAGKVEVRSGVEGHTWQAQGQPWLPEMLSPQSQSANKEHFKGASGEH